MFSENVTAFLNDLSTALLQDKEAKLYPDVVTFAFFCRKGNLERLRGDYEAERNTRIGRGLAFHIAPGNVPINFAYSLVAALLSGCPSVVKASSRDFAQTRIVCRVMTALLEDKHPHMKPYVNVVMYDRARQDITQWFSERCAARIVWGGDETVRRVRTALLAPRAVEVTFADRYSLLVIDADKLNAMTDSELAALSQGFYNDTYLTDQAACTSPQLIYWLGDDEAATEAKIRFWDAVRKHTSARYTVEAVTAVDKLTAACRAAIDLAGTHIDQEKDALITRVSVETLSDKLPAYRCHGGYFTEYTAQTLEPLADIVTPRYQTLSYIGLDADALRAFVRTHGLTGIDRISPVGHTMDFSLVWDGYDLVKTLSRQIYAF